MVFDRKYYNYYDVESNEYDDQYKNDHDSDTDNEIYIDEDEYNEVYTNILCVFSGIVVVIYIGFILYR